MGHGSWVNCVMGHMGHGSRKMTHFHLCLEILVNLNWNKQASPMSTTMVSNVQLSTNKIVVPQMSFIGLLLQQRNRPFNSFSFEGNFDDLMAMLSVYSGGNCWHTVGRHHDHRSDVTGW